MLDLLPVPERLEQAVGKAQRHDVLHRFLAEEMVDSIDLMLLQRFQDFGIESFGRSEVVTERLFDNDTTPLTAVFGCEPGGSERSDRRAEEAVGDRKIKQA